MKTRLNIKSIAAAVLACLLITVTCFSFTACSLFDSITDIINPGDTAPSATDKLVAEEDDVIVTDNETVYNLPAKMTFTAIIIRNLNQRIKKQSAETILLVSALINAVS